MHSGKKNNILFSRNYYLVFGLISETCLAVFLAYCPGISTVLGMYGLRLVTWYGMENTVSHTQSSDARPQNLPISV